jgi:ribosomal protein S6--L-glutamate ligase
MTNLSHPHVLVIAEQRYGAHLQPTGLVDALRRLRVPVRYLLVGDMSDLTSAAADLEWADIAVARGRSPEVLSLLDLAADHTCVVDGARAVRAVVDKANLSRVLLAAGVPTPPTWIAPVGDLAENLPDAAFPVICKPVFGDNARGLLIAPDRATLRRTAWPEDPALVQAYLAGDGADIKIYVVGESMTAIRKPAPFPPGPDFEPRIVPLTAELADIGRRCGELFGLSVFGVDCLLTSDGPVVIEVNDFPNFTGVPGADDLLAAHVLSAAEQRRLEGVGA